jgi:hypothetical protein
VAGFYEQGDEPSGSGATELVNLEDEIELDERTCPPSRTSVSCTLCKEHVRSCFQRVNELCWSLADLTFNLTTIFELRNCVEWQGECGCTGVC